MLLSPIFWLPSPSHLSEWPEKLSRFPIDQSSEKLLIWLDFFSKFEYKRMVKLGIKYFMGDWICVCCLSTRIRRRRLQCARPSFRSWKWSAPTCITSKQSTSQKLSDDWRRSSQTRRSSMHFVIQSNTCHMRRRALSDSRRKRCYLSSETEAQCEPSTFSCTLEIILFTYLFIYLLTY